MDNRKRNGISGLVTAIVLLMILSRLLPAIIGLIKVLIVLCVIAFIILLGAIIVSGLKSGEKEGGQKRSEGAAALTDEQKKALENARLTASRIKIGADKIKDAEISAKFKEVAGKTEKIISALKADPKNYVNGRRVMNYYASAVEEIQKKYLKLLSNNAELGDMPKKLMDNLTEISAALDKLYESFFDDDRLDLTVDMKALSAALKRDGLIDSNIEIS